MCDSLMEETGFISFPDIIECVVTLSFMFFMGGYACLPSRVTEWALEKLATPEMLE